jgi:hypothetical protein
MTNPQITTVTITSTPTLVFSGCGNVRLNQVSGSAYVVGGANVQYIGGAHTWFSAGNGVEFKADAELYAVCAFPGDTAVVRVERWF